MEQIHITINKSMLDELLKQNCIQDYTDDGYVFKKEAGWIPAGDVLEYLVHSEVLYEEKERREQT
tara:strand:- start:4 stop:198 length:195 start_codon:yes stop_codon:yes gene_type:complete